MPERKTVGAVLNKLIERVNSDIRRLRVLEQESSLLKTRLAAAEDEILTHRRQLESALGEANARQAKAEERVAAVESTTKEIIAQLKKVTTTTKIKELEQLIDIYNPIKSQFATREEVREMINERLRTRG
ncbi:MAG: hypothetical protein HY369_00195 [Candidatus Aenigmarchaeota archaeon]|nr:hypothetical protein [Candidatus Aenigmarchaeota archaeon]